MFFFFPQQFSNTTICNDSIYCLVHIHDEFWWIDGIILIFYNCNYDIFILKFEYNFLFLKIRIQLVLYNTIKL